MKKISSVLSLVVLLEVTGVSGSFAARRAHRPWLMIGSEPSEAVMEEVRPTPAPVVSQTPVVRPMRSTHRAWAAPAPAPRAETPAPKTGQKIASRALDYKGTRYKFGGSTKRGLDCSGLVSRVYQDLKMKRIPRASDALYNSGKPVRLSELRAGDLVFFKNTYKRGISHVGVYAGHNKFVHAANRKRGVTVTALSDPYYQLHYAGARRLY